jgi:nucleolar protein 56
MIIHASSLLETLDKDINLFLMKIREWYGWHFPELSKLVEDKHQYLRILLILRNKTNMTWEYICLLTEILGNSCKAKIIIEAARSSMGQEICTTDMVNIEIFAKHIVELSEYRQKLSDYIKSKMQTIAPNLSALVGFFVGSKLISQAGSLMNLAKCSASTVQILGAEKALFRAKISKQNTPKHGIIYHCSYVGRVRQRNKGRISRYVANKCAIAARVDAFTDGLTSNAFGIKLKDQKIE